MSVEKLIIIGSGPAAWTAAIYAARADLSPLVFEGALTEENRIDGVLPLGQLNWANWVQDFPGFPDRIPGPELIMLLKGQAERYGTRVVTESIESIDLASSPFWLTDSARQQYFAHALIIAAGARRRLWEFGFENMGVSVAIPDDCMLPRARNRPMAIIGGGDSAITGAMTASLFASEVFIIHRRAELRAKPYYIDQARANPKLRFLPQREIVRVLGTTEEGVKGLTLKNLSTGSEEFLPVSMIFPRIGTLPNTHFLANQVKLDDAGYIHLSNPPATETNVPGVFAAGEIADPIYRQAVTAAGMGCKAALDAERWLAAKGIH